MTSAGEVLDVHRRHVGLLALLVLVALAGCSVVPPDDASQGTDVPVQLTNDHDRTYVVTLGVAPADHRGFALEFANGTVREYPTATTLEEVPTEIRTHATSIRPIGDGVQTSVTRLEGSQGRTVVFADVPPNASITDSIASTRGDEPLRSFGRATCGPDATFSEVSIRITSAGVVATSTHCVGR